MHDFSHWDVLGNTNVPVVTATTPLAFGKAALFYFPPFPALGGQL